jgi:hypothetical protein
MIIVPFPIHEKTSFVYDGKCQCSEGHSELSEKDCDQTILIASFEASSNHTKLGRLKISCDWKSVAVITARSFSLNKGNHADSIRNNWYLGWREIGTLMTLKIFGAWHCHVSFYRRKRRSSKVLRSPSISLVQTKSE